MIRFPAFSSALEGLGLHIRGLAENDWGAHQRYTPFQNHYHLVRMFTSPFAVTI